MFVYNEFNGAFRASYPCFVLNNKNNNETAEWIIKKGIPEKSLIEWTCSQITKDKNFAVRRLAAAVRQGSRTG